MVRLHRKHKTEEVGPKYNGQYPLPETEVKETDAKKPPRNPESARSAVVFDLYFFHTSSLAEL